MLLPLITFKTIYKISRVFCRDAVFWPVIRKKKNMGPEGQLSDGIQIINFKGGKG